MNRREFFKLLAAAAVAGVTIGSIPIALAASDPRIKTWSLLEESRLIFKAEGRTPAYLAKTEELFSFMEKHFLPPVKANEIRDVAEVKSLLRDNKHFDLESCSDATFCVVIVRHGLKNLKLPMIQARNWKLFARHLTRIVMAA